jgi:hypothetical protein
MLLSLGVLVVLLGAYLLMQQSEKRSLTPRETDNFLALDSGLVNKITIRRLGGAVEFQKQGEIWTVLDGGKAYPTEKGAVEQIANLAHTMKVGEVISSNPDKRMLFQVDTLIGNNVSFYRDGNVLASVIVGKTAPDFQTTYVRKPEANDVYIAVGSFGRFFGRPAAGYRDKTLLTVDTMQIATVSFKGQETDYQIMHLDSLWRVIPTKGDAFAPDPAKMSQLLRQLSNVRWNNPITGAATAPDFSKPALQVDIAMRDGTTKALFFAAQGGESKDYFVRSSTSEEAFIVAEYVMKNLAKKPDELK